MTTPNLGTPNVNTPANKLAAKLSMVKDAIRRAEDNITDGQLSPASCAYIDGQLAKAIGWLASGRAIVITQGSLDHPHFDSDETIDLDQADASKSYIARTYGEIGGQA